MSEQRFVFWCKRVKSDGGGIIEHVATKYEGHGRHVRCVPIREWEDVPEP